MRRRLTPAVAVLVALFVAAAVLIAVEFAKGAAQAGSVQLANPCVSRPFRGDVVQRVVLDGLDGAACRLHVSREELVLSLDASDLWGRLQELLACTDTTLRAELKSYAAEKGVQI